MTSGFSTGIGFGSSACAGATDCDAPGAVDCDAVTGAGVSSGFWSNVVSVDPAVGVKGTASLDVTSFAFTVDCQTSPFCPSAILSNLDTFSLSTA